MASSRNFLQTIFLSPHEPRLRAGWRLLIQTALWLTLTVCLGIPFTLLSQSAVVGKAASQVLSSVVNLLAVTLSILVARRYLDRRSFISLGLSLKRRAILDVLVGILMTFLMMGAIYLTMRALNWAHVEGFAWQANSGSTAEKVNGTAELPAQTLWQILGNTSLYLLLFILVGWEEELLSRGYHLQTIASGTNLFWGTTISSAIFGLLHLGNPNATWVSTLGIFCAGLFLAYGYLRTGQLWLSIGLHIGWNFFEGVVFGFPVSGLETYRLMHTAVHGPELWTGGAFGPEAGLIILPAMALGSLLIYLYTRRRNPPQ